MITPTTKQSLISGVLDEAIATLELRGRTAEYFDDPVLWARDVLGVELWSRQQDIARSVVKNKSTAVKAAHGVGKSHLAGVLACWWVATRGADPTEVMVVSTAPTTAQVHAILWEEIRKNHAIANQRYKEGKSPMPLPGYITQKDQWKMEDGTLVGFGRKPQDGAVSAFQGIHRKYVLLLIDEACGISEDLWVAGSAITTANTCRLLAIGNPDDPATHFYSLFAKDMGWVRETIALPESPWYTKKYLDMKEWELAEHIEEFGEDKVNEWIARAKLDKDLPKVVWDNLTPQDWGDDLIKAWGKDSSYVRAKVYAEFPLESVNTLFSPETIRKAGETEITPKVSDPVILGVDLARFGPDYSTVFINQGGQIRLLDAWGGKADEVKVDGMESAARVHQLAQNVGANEVRVDAEGLGGPILDQIVRLSEGSYTVVAMRGSQASPDNFRWVNARAYWYDEFRQGMADGKIDLDLEGDDNKLAIELPQIRYHFKNRFKSLQIESKDDMRSRGVKSPDYADAAVYAAADMTYVTADPFGQFNYGDKVSMSTYDFLGLAMKNGIISPY